MSNKTIQLNPVFLSNSKISTPRRERKEKPQTTLKPNKMKKQLLAKIKDFQHKSENNDTEEINITYNELDKDKEEFDADFSNEFNKSLSFLSELSKQRKSKPKRNETLKKGKVEHEVHLQIATELPEEMKEKKQNAQAQQAQHTQHKQVQAQQTHLKEHMQAQQIQAQQAQAQQAHLIEHKQAQHMQAQQYTPSVKPLSASPLYSNLKNGTKPTYRQYHNKTQKNYGHETVLKPLIHIDNDSIAGAAGAASLVPAGAAPALAALAASPALAPAPAQRFKKRITRTLKYSLGKHKNGKVSVLIKNAKTRRKVQTEQAILKKKTIPDIKAYLRSKNLLKVGSDVPNDVLRQLYENAILAGDVTNKSKDTLIHNYFNENK
jgi:DNA polymerase III alpha subunit (gram-positive type)